MTIFCEYEKHDFLESDFVHRNDGSLFEPYIHDVNPVHFAVGSYIVSASSTPSLPPSSPGPFQGSTPPLSTPPSDPTYAGRPQPITVDIGNYNPSNGGVIVTLRSMLAVQLFLLALDMPIDALQALVRRLSDERNRR